MTAQPEANLLSQSSADRAQKRFSVEGNVVVTGGAGNLGFSTARALLEHGASGCCLWDLEDSIRASQAQILKLATDFPERRIFSIAVDVTDNLGIAEAVSTVVKTLGSLNHIFCFAGIVGCYHAIDQSETGFRKIIDVNTTGAFLCAQAAARQMMVQKKQGSVTIVASVSGHRVNFPQPQAAYNASKAAVIALKSSLAAEWAGCGIRVNSISPGYMDTALNEGEELAEARKIWKRRIPMGRMGAVGELDGVCVLLASRAGSYINGADFIIDGGLSVF